MKTWLLSFALLGLFLPATASADLFLVTTADGPGFTSPEEVAAVLEHGIIPTFDALLALKAKKKIVFLGNWQSDPDFSEGYSGRFWWYGCNSKA